MGVKVDVEVYQGPQWLSQVFREANFDLTVIAHTEPRDIDVYARDDWYIGYTRPEFRVLAKDLGEASSSNGSYEIRPLRLLRPEAPRP